MSNGVQFSIPIVDEAAALTARLEELVRTALFNAALPITDEGEEWEVRYIAQISGDGRWTEVSAQQALDLRKQNQKQERQVPLRAYKRTKPVPVAA
jgi:hypothetical protein